MNYAGPAVFLIYFFVLMLVPAVIECLHERRHHD
jgi:hypothetical protein